MRKTLFWGQRTDEWPYVMQGYPVPGRNGESDRLSMKLEPGPTEEMTSELAFGRLAEFL